MRQDSNGIVSIQSGDMLPTEQKPPTAFVQKGNNNVQVGHTDQINIILPTNTNSNSAPQRASSQLSNEYYNLFVLGCDEELVFGVGSFFVSCDRILEIPYTDLMIRETFAYLTESDMATIMTYPSLFMTENHNYGKTDETQIAYWGRVTSMSPHGRDVKITYHTIKDIPQQRLNELSTELCLRAAKRFNELNRTHWAIKRVNLLEELSEAHIALF